MTAVALQRHFPFAERREKRRLARVETAMDHLEVDEDKVLLLVLDGELVGFDLAGVGADRRLLGIWWKSIRIYETRRDGGILASKPEAIATEDVTADLFPPQRDLGFSAVKQALGVKSQHLHNLLDSKLMAAHGGDAINRAPIISRASVAAFLEKRRVQ